MPAAILILTMGALLVASSLKGVGLTDLLAGVVGDKLDPHGAAEAATIAASQAGTTGGGPEGNGTTGVAKAGNPTASGTSVGPDHPTAGLPGYPAKDYFAPSGSRAVAPVAGTIARQSGHNPAMGPTQGPHGPLGWSLYIDGVDGHSYFLTHLGSVTVKVGQKVNQGDTIGTVADYAKYGTASHIHMGVH